MLDTHDLIPLSLLAAGQVGRVSQVLGHQPTIHRLQELGMHDGAEVEMVQPGTPCIVRLSGQKLCLRANDLSQVLVRPEQCT